MKLDDAPGKDDLVMTRPVGGTPTDIRPKMPIVMHNAIPSNHYEFGVEATPDHDPVNHPSHYTAYQGLEIIDLTEQMNFNKGNAVKYIARAGLKNPDTEIQDLEKAAWYIQREIDRLKNQS